MERIRKHHSTTSYRLNTFRLDGLRDVTAGYRLVRVTGLSTEDTDFDQKIRLLCRLLMSETGLPVEPVRTTQGRFIGVSGSITELEALSLPEKKALTPEIVKLTFADDLIHPLQFDLRKSVGVRKLAERTLHWALNSAIDSTGDWWSYGHRYVQRGSDLDASNDEILVHHAFYYGFLPGPDGLPELSLDPSVCYVFRRSLFDEYRDAPPRSIKGQRFLYRYGLSWYKIDALGISGRASEVEITDPDDGHAVTIQQRIQKVWGKQGISEIDDLPADAFTIQYKTAGEKTRFAHSALLFRLPGTEGQREDNAHTQEAILLPEIRGMRSEAIIDAIHSRLRMFGTPLIPARRMRVVSEHELRHFPPPRLRFAGDQEVRTDLQTAGRDRFDALRGLGPAEATPFRDDQLILVPSTLTQSLVDDFHRRLCLQVQDLYGQSYQPELVTYSSERQWTLREHARAIESVLGKRNGYALLVLPSLHPGRQRRLHDYLKRKFWSRVQTQCARAQKLESFYYRVPGRNEDIRVVRSGRDRHYESYLRYLSLAYLVVNRKWLWKLAAGTLKHDIHVGIDVYKGTAVFTFLYRDADLISFAVKKSNRAELLSRQMVEEVLTEYLAADLRLLGMQACSIVIFRDGRLYEPESQGIKASLRILQERGSLASNCKYGMVEVHKRSSMRARVYRRSHGLFENPQMGTAILLGQSDAVLATTGAPMLTRGTAHPICLELADGDLPISDIAQDAYSLSHLAYTAPDKCHRLMFPLGLSDLILRESTPGVDDELWEETTSDEFVEARTVAVGKR